MSAKFLNSVERIQQLNKPLFLVICRRELAEFCKKFVDLWFSAKCTVHSKRINSVHYYINSVKTNSIMSTPTTYESFLSPKCFSVLETNCWSLSVPHLSALYVVLSRVFAL